MPATPLTKALDSQGSWPWPALFLGWIIRPSLPSSPTGPEKADFTPPGPRVSDRQAGPGQGVTPEPIPVVVDTSHLPAPRPPPTPLQENPEPIPGPAAFQEERLGSRPESHKMDFGLIAQAGPMPPPS